MNSGAADDGGWEEARSRAGILARTLPDAAADQRLFVAEAARELGVDRSTVFRWRTRFEGERRLSALLPKQRGRPKGHCQVDPRSRNWWRRRSRHSICAPNGRAFGNSWNEYARNADGLACLRHIGALSGCVSNAWMPAKRMMRREGAAAARAVFTPVVAEYRSAGPLDVVQIDTPLWI